MSKKVAKKGGVLQGRAVVDRNTVNATERTFEVVFATETPVLRYGWEENFNEVLAIESGAIMSARLDSGMMALINNHNQYSGVMGQMGVVRSWSIDTKTKEARAVIQFSTQEQYRGIFDDIEAGIIGNISVGYRVYEYDRSKKNPNDKTEVPTYRATKWEPMEVSLVSVPADVNSSVRNSMENIAQRSGNDANEVFILNFNNTTGMEKELMEQIRGEVKAAKLPESVAEGMIARNITIDACRTEIAELTNRQAAPAAAPTVTPAPADNGEAVRAAGIAENKRVQDITTLLRKFNLHDGEFGTELLSRKDASGNLISFDGARAAILDKLAEKEPAGLPASGGGQGAVRADERGKVMERMIQGLMHRCMPGSVERYNNLDAATKGRQMEVGGHDYKNMSLLAISRTVLQLNGATNVNNMSDAEVAQRALSTTDLPDLFTSVVKRFMRMYYEIIVPEWQMFSRYVPANDFRVKTGIKVDASVTFEELGENGEYKESNVISNEKATLQLKTFGRKFSISRHTIINDDLSVLNDLYPRLIATGARQFQSKKWWGMVTGNTAAPDGKALFHADHGNLNSTGSMINDGSLSDARTMMRRQKSPEGNELFIVPKFLIVPPELETRAQKFLRPISPTQVEYVNMWSTLEPIVNVYFSDPLAWYMFADPMMAGVDGFVHSYLSGQEGLFTESYIDKGTDALVIKSRLDFDCGVWGWQGAYKNVGASEQQA